MAWIPDRTRGGKTVCTKTKTDEPGVTVKYGQGGAGNTSHSTGEHNRKAHQWPWLWDQ